MRVIDQYHVDRLLLMRIIDQHHVDRLLLMRVIDQHHVAGLASNAQRSQMLKVPI